MDSSEVFTKWRELVESRLAELLPPVESPLERLSEAMRYSCLSPGKRLRPMICLWSAEAVRPGGGEVALDGACAIEMIHAFSLIHDDLPAIDDDDLRRGRPTCHKQFDEATAILAGDALFSLAFSTLSSVSAPAETVVRILRVISTATGVTGLVGGEFVDVISEGSEPDAERLQWIHARKTGALIEASCATGALLAGGDAAQVAALSTYGARVGLAFQIVDDILNETSTAEALGKSAGSDAARQKATYPALFGLDRSRQMAKTLIDEALAQLSGFGKAAEALRVLALFSIERLN